MGKDEKFMGMAIALALKTDPAPNPRVGAVIVKNGKAIASGYHRKAGEAHAEIDALGKLKRGEAKGSTIYVTLEPCSHYGRTPPCTKAIIRAGILKVVYAVGDPTGKVKGGEELKKAGIKVQSGVLRAQAEKHNPAFYKVAKTGLPFVTLKAACSLDGKIASKIGDSKWISSPASRRIAHALRAKNDAVLAGIGTVLADNPRLSARIRGAGEPLRIILDSRLRIALNARVLRGGRAVVAANFGCSAKKKRELESMGVRVLLFAGSKVPLKPLLRALVEIGVSSVLVEGGGEVNAGFVRQGLVDRYCFFVCPKIVGGRDAKSAVEGEGVSLVANALKLRFEKFGKVGADILVSAVPLQKGEFG
ncbi:bifunctional diaminohydroxyphosphoribosylaminopyrimidine deaminase/5-amino-6-(5-phosphoribosylamino)uracil reductase RibD [Candidatus Micrarchaeota archaeon]|nr:bifunctional diaminohydroxyphosphoribosylaminopyrimidine deaminase/5-amino-6-(5-phosphoribosylamino)uracil reductase RibD [Candidatus Micrarchaeota archaeon]